MIIAGGFYRETCELPQWDANFGSGGRAAVALAHLSNQLHFHTYRRPDKRADLYPIEALGVDVHTIDSDSEIAFSYLHPLSDPAIYPSRSTIRQQRPIRVTGDVALRFGFLEGDAVVEADRAVYDPQTATGATAFGANGSQAGALALVLNERELLAYGDGSDPALAVRRICERDGAEVIVVKSGVRGALLHTLGATTWIPAFRSQRIFKIGTGDVFSAAFAYYWGEKRLDAHVAADLASRSVAAYCDTRILPLPSVSDLPRFPVVGRRQAAPVLVVGAASTLQSLWLIEEVRWRLVDLGVEVECQRIVDSGSDPELLAGDGAVLVLADGLQQKAQGLIAAGLELGRPVVVLRQDQEGHSGSQMTTSDFTTALYWVAWA